MSAMQESVTPLEKFLTDIRLRATNALMVDYRAGEKIAIELREHGDGADIHEDIRETLWPFFEEIREYVEGPRCMKRIPVGKNAAYSCQRLIDHTGDCNRG